MRVLGLGLVWVSFAFSILFDAYCDNSFVGKIVCRFEGKLSESHSNMRALGDHLRQQQSSGYQPFFMVENNTDDPARIQASKHTHQDGTELMHQQIPITESMIENMIGRAEFRFNDPIIIDVPSQLSSTTIYLRMRGIHSEQTSFYPISGFPRKLVAEDTINGTSLSVFKMLH